MTLPDLTPIKDDEVLTLVLLDSTHPQIIAAATEIKNSVLVSANAALQSVEALKDDLLAVRNDAADSQQEKTEADGGRERCSRVSRRSVEELLRKTKAFVDVSLKLTLELDSLSFQAMKPIWGSEESARQSRRFLVQLLEKITSRGEALILFLSAVLQKLPAPASPPPPSQASPAEAGEIRQEPKPQEGGRGRGRGLFPPGAGRGRGLPLARGLGPSISPLGSNGDSDAAATPAGTQTDDARGESGSGGRKHERDFSPEESQRRWKKKPPSNVDWMLKCRTKLLELKERTAKKAVSDVFMTERTVQETISFIDHNATKLEVVAAKNASDFTAEDRRIFMQSIESYIAGLERALLLLAKETLNKRQLMGLFDSAVKVERLTTPGELLVEMKSITSLLNTFAYMPKMDDDD
ncbi:hypothetical protein Efla_006301 [Eimeria flavescens]